ncbi:hypothetical protein JCM10207_006801 [Rhodosporidiobolus poonsookiae]
MFRATARRLAHSAEISALNGSSCAPAPELLPPLQLYRRLLRVHRRVLPADLRVMGDEYVKAEFRRTRTTDNPLHIVGFLSEWKKYLDFHEEQLPQDGAATGLSEEAVRREVGKKLDDGILEQLSSDQIGQLYALFEATKDLHLSNDELAAKLAEEGLSLEGITAGRALGKKGGEGGEGEGR